MYCGSENNTGFFILSFGKGIPWHSTSFPQQQYSISSLQSQSELTVCLCALNSLGKLNVGVDKAYYAKSQ